jgi:hypothetical protein
MKQKHFTSEWELRSLLSQNVDLIKHVSWGRIAYQRDELLEVLEYYLPLLENCNRHGPEGDAARDTLAKDLGGKAKAAIAMAKGE